MTDRLERAIEVVVGSLIMVVVGTGIVVRMWANAGTITRIFTRKEKTNETTEQ